ncbi:restriction endonuclease subunit S [Streptococcus parasuis]|uniref:restriction endonuclease subunit S n=1 Tax=Streptococcus parasuis TaxID=1501662 RepID=UPI0028A1D741|nr:restriction endonuclease subunit S [Streptococcus parasuis]
MKTNNNIPAYRFQGYTDAWELRKLGECSTLITKGTTPRDKSGIGVVNFVKVENLVNGDIIPLQKIQLEEHEGYLKRSQLIENDILFSIAGTLGRTAIVKKSILPANTNQALSIIRGYEFDRNFLVTILRGVVVREFIKRNPTIGAQPNLSLEQVSNLCLLTPCSEEQSAIGTFFSTLDQHITLHQRKLDTLKEQKKTYLKLLFPAKGQTKPALRFQGFEDDWKEMKLGEVLVEYNKKSEIENQFELLSSTNSGIEPRSGRVSGESNIGYKIIKRGMVVLSPQNLWLGNINYNAKFEIGIVSPSYKVFNIYGPNELFLATVLRLPQMFFEYAQASVQGASIVRRNLDLDLFGSILVQLPSLPEQEFIGTFFQTLDQEIAQVEDKLASLKEMKKTLLRKLFV